MYVENVCIKVCDFLNKFLYFDVFTTNIIIVLRY